MRVSADAIREEKGKKIAETPNCVFYVTDSKYKVLSQSNKGFYDVEETEIGWKCNCPDHRFRGMKCKHIYSVLVSLGMRNQAKSKVIIEPIVAVTCPVCGSSNSRRDGVRHNKSGDL